MSRWHAQWCTSPAIQVGGDQVPHCGNCQATAHNRLKESIAERASPELSSVKDEEFGNLNLSWPPTVPYTARRSATSSPVDTSNHDQQSLSASCLRSEPVVTNRFTQPPLASDEFRLAVLHAEADKRISCPIHMSLETHKDKRFPEYDAVSYTWGGEADNPERCHPIYVGKYWNIVFQTQNCCDMLRFLRPSRGLRTIWVDAVCIDQNNMEERAMQVAKMGQIYSKCTQVWAWLGNDLVSFDSKELPERRWLHEIDTTSYFKKTTSQSLHHSQQSIPAAHTALAELLQRRYFRRVWVIQELMLAPRILIPIGNTVCTADRLTIQRLQNLPDSKGDCQKFPWQSTDAPWFQYITKGPAADVDLWDMMALTSKSNASDVRDKLYGLLGLLSCQKMYKLLQPNYSISNRHMGVGLFAHCIINEKKPELFFAAQGYAAGKSPSWLPDWETQRSWAHLFKGPAELADAVGKMDRGLDDYADELFSSDQGNPMRQEFRGVRFSNARPQQSLLSRADKRLLSFDSDIRYPWYRDSTIDHRTASISLWLTKLAVISSGAVEALGDANNDLRLYRIHHGTDRSFFVASRHPINVLVETNDEIFILDPKPSRGKVESDWLIFLILRPKGDEGHKLVTCFSYLRYVTFDSDSHMSTITDYQLVELRESLAQRKAVIQARLDLTLHKLAIRYLPPHFFRFLHDFFPGNEATTLNDIVPIITGHESSLLMYKNRVCDQLRPQAIEGYIQFQTTFGNSLAEDLLESGAHLLIPNYWEWSLNGGAWISGGQGVRPTRKNEGQIRLRCRAEDVRDVILEWLDRDLDILALWESQLLGNTLGTFQENLRSRPIEKDWLLASPGRKGELSRDTGLDGGTYRVCIF